MQVQDEGESSLVAEIRADARRQADRARQRAEREAAKVLDDARRQAEREAEEVLRDARDRARTQSENVVRGIDRQVRAVRQQARERVLDAVREKAREGLREAAGSVDSLTDLALAAVGQMSGSRFVFTFGRAGEEPPAEDLRRAVVERVKARLARDVEIRAADEAADGSGGLIVRSEDGKQVADQTCGARMRRLWPLLRQDVVDILFAEATVGSDAKPAGENKDRAESRP